MIDSWWPHDRRVPKIQEFGYQKEQKFVGFLDQEAAIAFM